jgi:rifampicin phosphotransferase
MVKTLTTIYFFGKDEQPTTVSIATVGGKAHSLVKMAQLHLPVPPGFVLPVEFFNAWFDQIKKTDAWTEFLAADTPDQMRKSCDALKNDATKLQCSSEQRESVTAALAKFNRKGELFAVRSSSPEEDLEGSSFAGGYETILGVTIDGIEDAIKKAFASCLDHRVAIYKKQHGFDFRTPKIAVVVQAQVASDVAGVGFSLNPISNSYDEIVINSNWGLGETVVAGIATPDTFIVDKNNLSIVQKTVGGKETSIWLLPGGGTEERADKRQAEPSLTDGQIVELGRLINQIEQSYERPMDIEWAFAEGTMYLLQARPITIYVPMAKELITAPGARKRLYVDVTICVQGLYKPISVLGTSFLRRAASILTSKIFGQDLTKSIDDSFAYVTNGRIYSNVSNLFEFAGQEKISKVLQNVDPTTGKIIGSVNEDEYRSHNPNIKHIPFHLILQIPIIGLHVLEARLLPEHAHRHVVQEVKAFKRDVRHLVEENLSFSDLSDELCDRLRKAIFDAVMPAFATSRIALERVKAIAGESNFDAESKELERGLPHNPTIEMGLSLYHIAQLLPEDVDSAQIEDRLAARDLPKPFLDAWDEFLELYGHRAPTELDMAAPRFREVPGTLLAQIVTLRRSSSVEDNPQERFDRGQVTRQQAFERLCEKIHDKGWLTLKDFSSLYRVYETLGGYREMPKYLLIYCIDTLRQRALKLGEMLFKEGRLDSPSQIFDLEIDQIEQSLKVKNLDLRRIAAENKVIINQLNAVATLPTVIDSRGKIITLPPVEAKEGEIVGTAVSAGLAKGPIKVLHSPDEKPLNRGDILVARATDPGWTPLFVNAAAVILEVGGMLQHGALVAREYGLPCVTGVTDATKLWKDGTMVEVDGTSGTIRLI